MWFTGGSMWPHHQYIKLGTKKPFRLLPLSKDVAQQVADRFGQEIFEMPAGVYKDDNGTNDAYWTPNTTVAFGVRTDLPDDLVYQITAALAEAQGRLPRDSPHARVLRPEDRVARRGWRRRCIRAAERFYREMGYLK